AGELRKIRMSHSEAGGGRPPSKGWRRICRDARGALRPWLPRAGWFIGWPFGCDLDHAEHATAKLAIYEATCLFALVLTATVGFVVGQIDKPDPVLWYILLYACVCLANIGGMVMMLRSRASSNGPHAFNRETVGYTRLSLVASSVLFITVGLL